MDRVASVAVSIPTGRVTRFLVIIVALVVLATVGKSAVNLTKVQKSATADVLPSNAEATKALQEAVRFPNGQLTVAAIIYRRARGLSDSDLSLVSSDHAALGGVSGVGEVDKPLYSNDHTSALLIARISPRAPGVINAVKAIRKLVGHGQGGLQIYVTGPAGFVVDSANVFGSIDATLFLATFLLVLVLLIIIYRSPVFWIIPLIAIVFAVATARGIAYYLGKGGVTITGQAGGIMTVLIFGVGTDYALLLVARYREELERTANTRTAAAAALRQAAKAIVPSAVTVAAALLCLLLAEVKSTSGLGAIGAIGVLTAMLTMLTLLPALLCLVGRWVFWPFVPQTGGPKRAAGTWDRIASWVERVPGRVAIGSALLLGVLAIGLVDLNGSLTTETGFRNDVDSLKGQRLVARAFPPGVSAPASATVSNASRLRAVQLAAMATGRVASLGSVERSHGAARFELAIVHDPYGDSGFNDIKAIRHAVKRVDGTQTLVGGSTAEELDLRTAQSRDNLVIIPLVLVLIVLILAVVLQAVVAPLILVGTVIASYAATLGLVSLLVTDVFHYAGLDPSLPLLGFILLVALGVDYNIFLMTRVRTEAGVHGTRSGMTRGLAATGGVITSAGVVLAGTFAMLALLPLVVLTEVGVTIALGALLDTFVVRSLLVPALVHEVGPATWWPSWLARAERGR